MGNPARAGVLAVAVSLCCIRGAKVGDGSMNPEGTVGLTVNAPVGHSTLPAMCILSLQTSALAAAFDRALALQRHRKDYSSFPVELAWLLRLSCRWTLLPWGGEASSRERSRRAARRGPREVVVGVRALEIRTLVGFGVSGAGLLVAGAAVRQLGRRRG